MAITDTTEPFDESTKTFYRHLFEEWGLKVESEYEVFTRSRTIDLVIEALEPNNPRLAESVFAHFRRWNILELKGVNDPLTVLNFDRIMMRAWGLRATEPDDEPKANGEPQAEEQDKKSREQELLPSQRTITIVCVTRPTRILNWLQDEYKFYPTEQPGIYYCNERLQQWIIHPSELALIPGNYPLLPLARGEKLAQFVELCLREGLTDYLQLVLDVGMATDANIIWQKILEARQMRMTIKEETWPYIDRYFKEVPEDLLKMPTFREMLKESEREGEKRGRLLNQHRTLLRLLEHKFGPVPTPLHQQIESCDDSAQLDRWLDQILAATAPVTLLPVHDDTVTA
ncbi:MAG: hypothetical protein DYG89_30790 [Caldilinea sp. CFX5]|nr:hypothetical protein [Caldilinea sp. CFX5]